jgi:hypothetical protein
MTNDHHLASSNETKDEFRIDRAPARRGAIMALSTSRTMIAALQVSLDGFMQGPNGEKDWVEGRRDA